MIILTMFAGHHSSSSSSSSRQKMDEKLEHVKGALEHLALYVGLAVYTALGAKVRCLS